MIHEDALTGLVWRGSSFSGGGDASGANCVETATLPGGGIAVRDSKNPVSGAMFLSRAGMAAWIDGIKADNFDEFA